MLIYKYQVCTKLYSGAQLCINSQFKPAGLHQVRAGSCISGIYRPLFWHGSMHAAWAEDLSSAWKISTPTAAAGKASRVSCTLLKRSALTGTRDIRTQATSRAKETRNTMRSLTCFCIRICSTHASAAAASGSPPPLRTPASTAAIRAANAGI